jgi:type I restriction enzyme S subunit
MTLAAWPTYDNYKDSGVHWIGQIPAHWEQLANKHIFRLKKSLVGKRSSEYELLSLTLRGIVKRDMENPEGKFPAEFDTYQEVTPGDFVFCHFDVEETPRTVGLSDYFGMITGAYTVYSVSNGIDPRFLLYFYTCADTDKKMRSLYKGLRNTIPKEAFGTFKSPLPPIEEQLAIVALLDEKCAKVDEAVRIKEEQIALLRERRQILIQQAVTRGLNPAAPMKDSGIGWIGQIPAHWKVQRNKHMFVEVNERSAKGTEQHLSMSQKLGLVPANLVEKSLVSESYEGAKLVRPGDLVLNRLKAHLAVFSIAPMEGLVSPDYSVFRPFVADASSRYFEALFKTSAYLGEFRLRVRGIVEGFYRLYTDSFMDVPLLIPPQSEQTSIMDHLERLSAQFDDAVRIKEEQIGALKEYKTSLINAAVTGKIKVA